MQNVNADMEERRRAAALAQKTKREADRMKQCANGQLLDWSEAHQNLATSLNIRDNLTPRNIAPLVMSAVHSNMSELNNTISRQKVEIKRLSSSDNEIERLKRTIQKLHDQSKAKNEKYNNLDQNFRAFRVKNGYKADGSQDGDPPKTNPHTEAELKDANKKIASLSAVGASTAHGSRNITATS